MKKLTLAALLCAALSAHPAAAQTCTTAVCKTDGAITVNSGGSVTVKSGGTLAVESGGTLSNAGTQTLTGGVNTSGIAYSTALTGNPLMQHTRATVTAASANVAQTILASSSGKSIILGNPMVYVSGTAAGATSIALRCSGGNPIVVWPIAMLANNSAVDAFVSQGGAVASRAAALVSGCPASEAVQVSTIGSALTTTTHLYFNVPYAVQ